MYIIIKEVFFDKVMIGLVQRKKYELKNVYKMQFGFCGNLIIIFVFYLMKSKCQEFINNCEKEILIKKFYNF